MSRAALQKNCSLIFWKILRKTTCITNLKTNFIKNCYVDVFLRQYSFLQYKFSFSFCGLIYGLRIVLQLLNVYYQELHCYVPRINKT